MGMSVGGSNRGIFVEMNVVPLIDVLLVLLVIFMIIPHKQKGLMAELPQPAEVPADPQPAAIVVQVFADESLRINQEAIGWDRLSVRLQEIFGSRANHTAFVRGDGVLQFQVIAKVIDVMRAAGVSSVGLMTPELEKLAETD